MPEKLDAPALQVKILLYERSDSFSHYHVDILHRLLEAGHVASFARKSLIDLGMDVKRVANYTSKMSADAWVVTAGSRDLLQWFAQQQTPAFALAGRRQGVQIAATGPDKKPALRNAVRRLITLGHRRIVMLAREIRRKPKPGGFEQTFLDELTAQGIPCGDYNLPHWDDNEEGFHRCLDRLFSHTPPTALIVGEMPLFIAAREHLAQMGILAPRDVSMVCDDPHPAFDWCRPSIAHIHWDSTHWSRRIVQWADNVALGKKHRRQSFTKATFIDGRTIGPVPD
ncbi:MAG: substrate-binding domain-containing protein [Akkermansiaceae bacterium]